jgi:hypothetical protein
MFPIAEHRIIVSVAEAEDHLRVRFAMALGQIAINRSETGDEQIVDTHGMP